MKIETKLELELQRVQLGWDLVTAKAIAYDSHHFYTHQTIQWTLVPSGLGHCHPGRLLFHIQFLQLLLSNPEIIILFPGQIGSVNPPVCCGSALGSPPSCACWYTCTNQMAKPHQLVLFRFHLYLVLTWSTSGYVIRHPILGYLHLWLDLNMHYLEELGCTMSIDKSASPRLGMPWTDVVLF